MMFGMACKWSGNRDHAADITHNAFLKMAAHLHQFRGKSSFRTWLCRIVINTAKDWARNQSRREVFDPVMVEGQPSTSSSAEDHVYAQEIMRGIAALPEGERMAILLVCGEGFSHREAAQILGCMEATVSWRIHSARKKLDKIWNGGRDYHG